MGAGNKANRMSSHLKFEQPTLKQMWQSRVEIEGYSVARISIALLCLECRIRAHTCFADINLRSPYEPRSYRKSSDTALQTQQCDRNTQWPQINLCHFILFLTPCSIVRSFEVLVSIFARQLEYGDCFSLVTENVLFVAELVSWVTC